MPPSIKTHKGSHSLCASSPNGDTPSGSSPKNCYVSHQGNPGHILKMSMPGLLHLISPLFTKHFSSCLRNCSASPNDSLTKVHLDPTFILCRAFLVVRLPPIYLLILFCLPKKDNHSFLLPSSMHLWPLHLPH